MRPLLICAFALSVGMLLGAEPLTDALPFPHPPTRPSRRGQPPADRHQASPANNTWQQWQDSLTPEQKAAWRIALGEPDPAKSRRLGSIGLPKPGQGYDWRAPALLAGLNDAELARLGRDKVLLEDVTLTQSFEAYTEPPGPVFITSDSVLNAFHVLFEDTFRDLELHRVAALRRHLERLLVQMRHDIADKENRVTPAELAPGLRHAQLVLGPALRLLGTDRERFDADLRDEIDRQAAKIRAADTAELPAWLGPPTRGLFALDYRDCQPIGFYAGNRTLENYYRAVRWLQLVPFRPERDVELIAISLLAQALGHDNGSEAQRFFNQYTLFLGQPDDPGLDEAGHELANFPLGRGAALAEELADRRRWLVRDLIKGGREEWTKLRNTLQLPPGGAQALTEIQFRVLPAYRLPDSLALQGTGKPGRLPSGLVVAALLGSDFARGQLPAAIPPDQLAAALKSAGEEWHPPENSKRRREPPSLYNRYLEVLAALTAPPEPDAPAFMRGEVWSAKSCQTVLAGWAQMRHTFTLQAKDSKTFFGLFDRPPGFVEPNPEFFYRFSALIEWTVKLLEEGGAFQSSASEEAETLRAAADTIEKMMFHQPGASFKDLGKLSYQESAHYDTAINTVRTIAGFEYMTKEEMRGDAAFQAYHRQLLATIRAAADDYDSGRRQAPAAAEMRSRWGTLKSLANRFESLAHKQLRQQPWSMSEAAFIRGYGEKLAVVMGYFGDSWLTPRDDAPRWTTVAGDPSTGTRLAVATGRARLIHVLYPWQGGEILCTGSVMSYYEYPSKGHLTDTAWLSLLDSPEAPATPDWLSPYLVR